MPTPTLPLRTSRWLRWLLALVVIVTALTMPPAPARAATITVAVGGSLQTAVNNAQPGDVIRLAGNTQANESVNLALMGSAIGSGPGNLTITGVNGASATLLGGNGTRLSYNSGTPFPGTLTLDRLTFSTSASTTTPALSLQNMGSVFVVNSLFDGIGAEGCTFGVSGCTALFISVSSGSPTIGLYSNTFRNIGSDAVNVEVLSSAQASVVSRFNLFTDNGLNTAVTNTGLQVVAGNSATANVTVSQNSFSALEGRAVDLTATGDSIVSTSVVSNTVSNMIDTNLGVITLATGTVSSSPVINAIVADNQIDTVATTGILAMLQSTGASTALNVQILRNQIANVDTASNKKGIFVLTLPTYTAGGVRGSVNARIEDNAVSGTGGSGIRLEVDDVNVASSIRNNTLSNNDVTGGFDEAAISALVGNNNFDSDSFALNAAIINNTVGPAGMYIESVNTQSPVRLESSGDAITYVQNNNTFNGGGTVTNFGTITGIALNSVARPPEQLAPSAATDSFTVPASTTTLLNVLANDREFDVGDVVSLLSFQPVSVRGATIARNDNGTPANLADDQVNFTPLPGVSGLDQFYYVVRDNGGRTSINLVTVNVIADSTPPDTTITIFPPNPSNDNTPTFQFTGTDNVTAPASLTFECRIYLSTATPPAFSSCTSPFTSATLPDGTYIFQVRARDGSGNIDPTPAQYTWVIDTTAPTASFTSTPANPTNSTAASFAFTGTDGSGTGLNRLECSLDGAAFTTCTSPQSFSGLSEGAHTFRVRAVDNTGNTQSTPASYAWVIDLTAPDTTITSNPTALSNSANASFSFTGSDPTSGGVASGVASFECSLDGGAFAACTSPRTYSGLADGSHTFEVRARDVAGNADATPATYTWTIDTTAPPAPVVITPATASVTNNTQPPITGTAEPNATVAIFIDGSVVGTTTADGAGNWAFTPVTPLSQGAHTVRARATDAAGNASPDSGTNTFTVDSLDPDTTFTATPPAASNSTAASFSFSGNGTGSAISRFECSLDGAAFATCTSPQNLSGLAEGSHTFRVRAIDTAGNLDGTPASYTWVVDLTAPDTTITANPPALSSSANASFSFTGSDPTSGGVASGAASFECSLDGGAFAACTSPRTYSGLADGSHTFEVRALDAAGNVDATPASYTWTIDTTSPVAPLVSSPANGSITNNARPPVSGTAEPGATVTVLIDGSPVGTTTADGAGSWSFTPPADLAEGSHNVRATATDAAGNTSPDSNINSFTVDTLEPDTSITAGPPAATSSTSASFSFSADGTGSAISRLECSLDGAAFTTCTSPQTYTGLAEGSHSFQVRAVDAAGNAETSPATRTWVVDVTAPDTTFITTPPALSNSSSATFLFSGADPGGSGVASFECSLDGGAFTLCASPLTLTGLSDGSHTLAVRAVDAAGNRDATPASYTWTIDTTASAAPVTLTPADGSIISNTQPPVSGTAEPGTTVTVVIDGIAVGTATADASGNWSLTPSAALAEGSHTVRARATDAAGNTSPDSNTNSFTVDTLEPDTTFTATPPAVTGSTSASFSFSGDGTGSAISRFECSLDGAAYSTCTSPLSLTGLADGSHTLAVRAVDAAGNVDPTPASYTWTVDLTSPDTTIDSGPADPTNSASATFTFSGADPSGSGVAGFECSVDGAAYSTCTSPLSLTGLADGSHTVSVRAIDAAGNVDPTPATYTWTIDTAPVDVTIEQAAAQADPTGAAPIVFEVAFTKPVTGFDGADVDLSASTAPGALSAAVSGSGATYTVTVSGMTGGGTIVASLPQGAAVDSAGNVSEASKSADNSVTFDPATPIATGIVLADANPSAAASVRFNVSFSEPVTGVDTADFTLAATGVAGASITSVTGSGATYVVTVAAGSGDGTLGLNLSDDDSVRGAASGVPLGGAGAGNGAFTGQVYTIDRTAPAAALLPLSPVVKDGADFSFTVVFSDALAVAGASLNSADLRVSGPGGFSQLATLTGVTPAGDAPRIEATYAIQAPGGAWDLADNGVYQIALEAGQVRDTAGNSVPARVLGSFDVGLGVRVYLPVVRSATPPAALPDLIVERVGVSDGLLQVVIKNQGGTPVTVPFWVDAYIDPTTVPTRVNQTWPVVGSNGAVWGVTEGALPLAPGASLTLTAGDAYFRADLSRIPASIAAGAALYAQVDSANVATSYGAVLEGHERDGGVYNNITGGSAAAGALRRPAAPADWADVPARRPVR